MDAVNVIGSSIFCGGIAGLVVDCVLFPIDTIRTRLQSKQGFKEAGGFRGIYSGILTQICLSAPTAALFFFVYETLKFLITPHVSQSSMIFIFMATSSLAETAACLVRVPMEVIKQRRQVAMHRTTKEILKSVLETEGFKGLYRGYSSTILREVPYALVQLTIYELLKMLVVDTIKHGEPIQPWEDAFCGAVGGAIGAAVTTPMDVIKTRIMVAEDKGEDGASVKIPAITKTIYQEKGLKGFAAGLLPRVVWMFMAGFVFFGTFSLAKMFYEHFIDTTDYHNTERYFML